MNIIAAIVLGPILFALARERFGGEFLPAYPDLAYHLIAFAASTLILFLLRHAAWSQIQAGEVERAALLSALVQMGIAGYRWWKGGIERP